MPGMQHEMTHTCPFTMQRAIAMLPTGNKVVDDTVRELLKLDSSVTEMDLSGMWAIDRKS